MFVKENQMKHKLHYDLEVLVDNKPVFEYEKGNNVFIEGRKNSKYTIRIRNHTSKRILAILSVDGLSVMDGKDATTKSNGYVVPAYGTITVPGWLLDQSNVAAFEFGSKEESYKANSDHKTSAGTGVIGCLIYPEIIHSCPHHSHIPNTIPWDYWQGSTPKSYSSNIPIFFSKTTYNPSAAYGAGNELTRGISFGTQQGNLSINNASFEMGTKFGEQQEFKTRTVEFERDRDNMVVMQLYYDSRKGLINRGIKVAPIAKKEVLPQAFKNIGCKPPADWS